MKRLSIGTKHHPWWLQGCWECPICGTIYRLEPEDKQNPLFRDVDSQRDGKMLRIPCEVCGNCQQPPNEKGHCVFANTRQMVRCPRQNGDDDDGWSFVQ